MSPAPGFSLTFLGTGTSVGVPMVGCDCEVCRSADPRDKRLRSSLYVRGPGCDLVIDTGPDFRTQCLREGIRHLDAALFTHAHTDHIMGFDDLRRFTVGQFHSLDIYARPETLAAIKTAFGFAFNGENRYVGYLKPEPHEVAGPFALGDAGIRAEPVACLHGKVETIGYQFSLGGERRFAYLPDCKTLPPESIGKLRGVPLLIIDALRLTEHPTHMNIAEATAAAEAIRPGATIFTHFSCEVGHARESANLPPGIRLAYDGMKVAC